MASVWGGSWGRAFGDAWGVVSGESSSGWRRLWLAAETQKALDARNAKRSKLEGEKSPELAKDLAKPQAKKTVKKSVKVRHVSKDKDQHAAPKPFVIGERIHNEPSMYERIGVADFFNSYSISAYKATIEKNYQTAKVDSDRRKREEEEFIILMAT